MRAPVGPRSDHPASPASPASRARRWGVTYTGRGDAAAAADAVAATLSAAGMRWRREPVPPGSVRITGVQQAPWHRVVARHLAQRAEWWVEGDGDGLSVTSDFRLHPWCAALVLSLGLLAAAAYLALGWLSDAHPGRRQPPAAVVLAGILLATAALFWAVRLVAALRSDESWRRVLRAVEGGRGALAPAGSGISRRYALALLALVGLRRCL